MEDSQMAQTVGRGEKRVVSGGPPVACAWIGPTAADAELLTAIRDAAEPAPKGSFGNRMVDALAGASGWRIARCLISRAP